MLQAAEHATYQSQLPANIAHCYSTREEYTGKPRPNVQKIRSSVPTNTFTSNIILRLQS